MAAPGGEVGDNVWPPAGGEAFLLPNFRFQLPYSLLPHSLLPGAPSLHVQACPARLLGLFLSLLFGLGDEGELIDVTVELG